MDFPEKVHWAGSPYIQFFRLPGEDTRVALGGLVSREFPPLSHWPPTSGQNKGGRHAIRSKLLAQGL